MNPPPSGQSAPGIGGGFTLCFVLGCAALLLGGPAATRADESVQIRNVVIGFDGVWKVGDWSPVRVEAVFPRSMRAALVIECVDADENVTVIPSEIHTVPAGRAWLAGSFKAGRLSGDMRVRVVSDGTTLASSRLQQGRSVDEVEWNWKPGQRLDSTLWLALGDPGGLKAFEKSSGPDPMVTVVPVGAEHVPRLAHALSAVDGIILAATPQLLLELDARQNLALRDWTRTGGHLFVAAGGQTVKTSIGEFAPPFTAVPKGKRPLPVSDWLPLTATGTVDLRQLSGLEGYVGQAAPLRFSGAIETPRLGEVDGTVLVGGTFGPILVRLPFGFGRISFLSLDLTKPPLRDWPALPRLYRRILGARANAVQERTQGGSVQLSRGGTSDLATQLHGTQDDFPAVRRPSYWQVLLVLLAVLLVVGPLDYLIVTRWLKRPEWTWISLPLFIALGVAGVQGLAVAGNGRDLLLNEFDLVDIDASSQVMRGRSWLTIYSPASQRVDLLAEPDEGYAQRRRRPKAGSPAPTEDAVRTETMLTWSAPPEESLGGLYRSGGANLTQRGYLYDGTSAALLDVAVSQWSTKAFVAEWSQPTDLQLNNQLEQTSLGRLSGTITHHLPGLLEQCLLVHGGHVYLPPGSAGRLAPGQPWRVANARGLKSVLTNARTIPIYHRETRSQQYLTQPEAYNPLDRDRDALMRILTFHQGVDGTRHTGMNHAALARMELTPVLDFNRAVLVGRMKSPPMQWTLNGRKTEATERHTFVRLVLPVARAQNEEKSTRPYLGPTDASP